MASARPRTGLFWALRIGWVLIATVLGLEGVLRLALFHPNWLPMGEGLRNPGLFFYGETPDFWLLRAHLRGRQGAGPAEYAHPVLGWTSGRFNSESYEHEDEADLNGRRPVILLGDSFAGCHGDLERRFEQLMDEGPLGETHALLNYGVGGYGVDQIVLLGMETLKRFEGQDAVFILSMLVDDDLNRVILPFRGHPKPWVKSDGQRAIRIVRPPLPADPGEYLDLYTPRVPWWSLRLFRQQVLMNKKEMREASGIALMQESMRRTVTASVLQFHDQLKAQGEQGFVMLFLNRNRQEGKTRPGNWLPWLESVLEGHHIPWVRASNEIALHQARTGRPMDDYFATTGPGKGHYTALGNELTHLSLERGIRQAFDGPSFVLQEITSRELIGKGAYSRWERFSYGGFTADDLPHTLMRAGAGGRAQLLFKVVQNARQFSAILRPLPAAKGASRLVVRTEAGDVGEFVVREGDEDQLICVPLGEVEDFELFAFPVEGQEPLAFFLIHPRLDSHRPGTMIDN